MTEEHRAIDRAFEPRDLEPLLARAGITRTVIVQSAANDADTDYLFELCDPVDWVGGVVAWVPLDDPDTAAARLRALRTRPKLRGIRHLIHQEPDPHWILGASVQLGLELLVEAELVLELPAEFPNHLEDVPELARRHPGLTIVVDHLAKPPADAAALPVWREQLAAAADQPNVLAKVSGLDTGVDVPTAVAAAVEAFGARRLMFGSDWPVSLLTAGYEETVGRTISAIRDAAGDDAGAILGDTARRVYGLA